MSLSSSTALAQRFLLRVAEGAVNIYSQITPDILQWFETDKFRLSVCDSLNRDEDEHEEDGQDGETFRCACLLLISTTHCSSIV
jgi:hypothetical protein